MSNVSILYESLSGYSNLAEARKGDDGEKWWYIKGVFAVAEKKNNNNRLYPWKVLEKSCDEYIDKYVKTNRALGCLDHPKTPETDGKTYSHVVTKMWPNKSDRVYEGEARIIKEGCGLIAKGVFEAGGVLAVSTRGVGSVVNGVVQENYRFFAIDLVHCPGASDAVVQAICEAEEYLLEYGNKIYAPKYKEFHNVLEHSAERSERLQSALLQFLRN